jgi:hypothetical protein
MAAASKDSKAEFEGIRAPGLSMVSPCEIPGGNGRKCGFGLTRQALSNNNGIDVATMDEQAKKPDDYATLYYRAFEEYGTRALWNMRPVENPTKADALAITKALRTHGGMDGLRMAEQIEKQCRPQQRHRRSM